MDIIHAKDQFKYPDGSIAKKGDICFYSEAITSGPKYHYADAIVLITEIDGVLFTPAKVFTKDEREYCLIDEISPVELCYGANHQGILADYKKIGESPRDDYMLTVEYATENFPLPNQLENK